MYKPPPYISPPLYNHIKNRLRKYISPGLIVGGFRRPPPSRSAKGTSRAPYMHEFSWGSRACSSGKFLNLGSLKCHFLDFGERFHWILMVRKRHYNISEALANVFALSPKPGGPHLAHLGWGPPGSPGLSPIVVTPLIVMIIIKFKQWPDIDMVSWSSAGSCDALNAW
jgi:hypothetical protein